jgi:hypothetical protein
MRIAFALSLLAALLSGCASHSNKTPDGVWINQAAIDAAVEGGNLRQSLLAYGPTLEWDINTAAGQATFYNGFELAEGKVARDPDGSWKVNFYGSASDELKLKGDELIKSANDSGPEQHFRQPKQPAPAGAQPGTSFESALYGAYLGGKWTITEGDGQGSVVEFQPDGSVSGMPGNDRYALCLAGDCASMSGEYDSMWLEKNERGNPWIFVRQGKQLEIFQAVNTAQPSDMPELRPGERRWVLQKN